MILIRKTTIYEFLHFNLIIRIVSIAIGIKTDDIDMIKYFPDNIPIIIPITICAIGICLNTSLKLVFILRVIHNVQT